MKFRIGRGERYAVVPRKYRLYFAKHSAPLAARETFYTLCEILNSDQAEEYRDVPQTMIAGLNGWGSTRNVERGLAWLKQHGIVTVKSRSGYPNLYFLAEPPKLKGDDADVMKRLGICPCMWGHWCPVHPKQLSAHLWK